ncbi:MAG: hypothetical protein C5B57_07250 [Blastocatellia bacterium]|nr:MAG: hypothetical protein C5B57_07250 [Blastocatellia bacterium]
MRHLKSLFDDDQLSCDMNREHRSAANRELARCWLPNPRSAMFTCFTHGGDLCSLRFCQSNL